MVGKSMGLLYFLFNMPDSTLPNDIKTLVVVRVESCLCIPYTSNCYVTGC